MTRQIIILAIWAAGVVAGEGIEWATVEEGRAGDRQGAMLVFAPDRDQMILVGPGTNAPSIEAFDTKTKQWTELSAATPVKGGLQAYYQTAYDSGTKTVFCLAGGNVLYSFSLADKTWKTHPAAPELEGLSWQAVACDSANKKLVVVGSDKRADNVGWMRTVVYDIAAGTWTTLKVADEKIALEHRELVAAKEAVIELIGRVRLAWYRDPKGAGSESEIEALKKRCAELKAVARMDRFGPELETIARMLVDRVTLSALKEARALQRKIEVLTESQYPVPCSRRNSPLAFDAKNNVFVLFGGDHEDYLMNDTWVLDLAKGAWKRMNPELAPSPRAGHALCALPGSGGVGLYEGYMQSSSEDYAARSFNTIEPLQLWIYDPKADRWSVQGAWPATGDGRVPSPAGIFYGYACERYSPPALAANERGYLVLARHSSKEWYWKWKHPAQTWMVKLDAEKLDGAARAKLGTAPNQRLYRGGEFVASFCEVDAAPKETGLDALPENQWVKLPAPPRNPCRGCRQRDWSTCVWDADRDQILMWGGGHCVRSASTVAHYSPVSGRIVEGFDADEPYGGNGGGGFDSSLLNRPWVSTHSYAHYAYDPVCKLLVSSRGYLYDPERMDWLRAEQSATPFRFVWGATVVKPSAHGAVAWATKKGSDGAGMWLFDRAKGWQDLEPKGKLFVPWCDSHGMVYDSKRDRMLIGGVKGAYEKEADGSFLSFDFKTNELTPVVPQDAEHTKARNSREMVYVEHADCVLIGELLVEGDKKTGKAFTRVYDCEKNKSFLLDAGRVADGHSVGWMYDARRKLVYAFSFTGEAWAMRVDLKRGK